MAAMRRQLAQAQEQLAAAEPAGPWGLGDSATAEVAAAAMATATKGPAKLAFTAFAVGDHALFLPWKQNYMVAFNVRGPDSAWPAGVDYFSLPSGPQFCGNFAGNSEARRFTSCRPTR